MRTPSFPPVPPDVDPKITAQVDKLRSDHWSFLINSSHDAHPFVDDERLVSQPDIPPFTPIVRGDWLDLNLKTPMLVEDVMPREGVALMYAEPETGKTPVALDLALCIANGLDSWAGQHIMANGPQDVLFIAYEGGASIREYLRGWLREHPGCTLKKFWLLEDWQNPMSGNLETIPPLVEKLFDNDTRTWRYGAPFLTDLTDWISGRFAPVLVIVDTQVDALGALDENNAPDTLALYSALRRWSAEFGHLTLFLHHTSKAGDGAKSYRGSTAFAGKADSMILLEKWTEQGRGAGKLSFTKSKGMRGVQGKRPYTGLRNHHGDDYCVSWQSPSLADLAASPEAQAVAKEWTTVGEIWRILDEAVDVDPSTGVTVPKPMSVSGVSHALRELATRENDRVDVLYGREKVGKLLDDLNKQGIVVNIEDTMTNGKPAKWVAGAKPVAGWRDSDSSDPVDD